MKSKDATNNGASTSSQGQTLGAPSPVIQLGAAFVVLMLWLHLDQHIPAAGTNVNATFIIEERLQEVLKSEAERISKVISVVKFRSLYSSQVFSKLYPKDYIKPKLRKFDGRKGNLREHIVSYIDDLGKYADDENLRLMEFFRVHLVGSFGLVHFYFHFKIGQNAFGPCLILKSIWSILK